MTVSDEYLSEMSKYKLKKAVLIYQSSNGVLCTLNNISVSGKTCMVENGIPINGTTLQKLFKEIKNPNSGKAKFLQWHDERILASVGKNTLWYVPSKRREIFFSCDNKKLMAISGKMFYYPAMIFFTNGKKLYVYCLSSDERPTIDTILYEAPFWNVSTTGRVCLPHIDAGNHTIDEWEAIFFKSAFSHPGGARLKRGTVESVFPGLIKKDSPFPVDLFNKSKITIKNIMEGRIEK